MIDIARKNELETRFPKEICDALACYFKETTYWTDEDWKKEAISEYIIKVAESWLREKPLNSQENIEAIKEEIKNQLKSFL